MNETSCKPPIRSRVHIVTKNTVSRPWHSARLLLVMLLLDQFIRHSRIRHMLGNRMICHNQRNKLIRAYHKDKCNE